MATCSKPLRITGYPALPGIIPALDWVTTRMPIKYLE